MNHFKKNFSIISVELFPLIIFTSATIFSLLSYFLINNQYFTDMVGIGKETSSMGLLSIFFYLLIFSIPFLIDSKNTKVFNFKVGSEIIFRYALFSLFLCVVGNLLFFRFFYQNPEQLLAWTQTGSTGALRIYLGQTQIPGITTMTQFGIPSLILFMLLYLQHNYKKSFFFILIIFLFAFARSFLFSERLAIIEIMLPILVLLLHFSKIKLKSFAILAFIFFAMIWSFEFFRSYANSWYNNYYDPFFFLVNRFFMYFATTVNNYLITFNYFEYQYFMSGLLAPFYQFFSSNTIEGFTLLERYGSPEFNSPFYFGVFYRNFWFLSPLFVYLTGLIIKTIYLNFRKRNFFGLYFFPVIFISIVDIRIMYLLETRIFFFYFVFFLIVIEVLFRKKMRPAYDN